MFGANFFSEIDFERSMATSQYFKQEEDVELSAVILRLTEASVLVHDVKRLDLKTGQMSDYGFAVQPLIHKLKNKDFLIGGRYQMPVFKGPIPAELRALAAQTTTSQVKKPREIMKQLVSSGKVEKLQKMQIVAQISDIALESSYGQRSPTSQAAKLNIPSMLHHFDKTDLESNSLEHIFSQYDSETA